MPMKNPTPRLFISVSAEDKLKAEHKAREMGLSTAAYLKYMFVLGEKEHNRVLELSRRLEDNGQES